MGSAALLVLLAGLAAAMASSTSVFVRWAAGARTGLRAAVVVFLLLMMLGMLVGGLVYELWPSRQSAVAGLWLASVIMSASVVVVFVGFVRELRQLSENAGVPTRVVWRTFVPTVVVLVVASEAVMGWTFGVAAGSLPRFPGPGASAVAQEAGRIVVSPWFTFPMVVEMALTLVWLGGRLDRSLARLLVWQPAVMFCSPPALSGWPWQVGSAVGASAAMALSVVVLLRIAYASGGLPARLKGVTAGLLVAFALMSFGLAVWATSGSLALLAAGIVAEMAVFVTVVIRPETSPIRNDGRGPDASPAAPA